MLLYKHVDIVTWPIIKVRFQHLLPDVVGQKSYTLKGEELAWVGSMLCNQVKKITGRDHQIKSAIVFAQAPENVQELHVDGFTVNRAGASNWALNLPITEVGEMLWYGGKFHLSETANGEGLKYLQLNWDEEHTVIESAMIDRPTIVRVDVPHQVINQSKDQRRLILSARFTPDIYDGEIS